MYRCFIVSLRSRDDSFDFEAKDFDDTLKKAKAKTNIAIADWELCYNAEAETDDHGMEGLIRTYKANPYILYIHGGRGGIMESRRL